VILLAHYVGGLFDTFWIGASTIAPFVVAGVCLGLADLARMRGDPVANDPTAVDVIRDTIIGLPTRRVREPVVAVRRMVASATTQIAALPSRLARAGAVPATG
jgi:hypothetical protein